MGFSRQHGSKVNGGLKTTIYTVNEHMFFQGTKVVNSARNAINFAKFNSCLSENFALKEAVNFLRFAKLTMINCHNSSH